MLRELYPIERFMCKAGQEEPIFFTMTARIIGELTQPELESALCKARQKHPLSTARMVDGDQGLPWFEATDPAVVSLRVIENGTDKLWLSTIAEELAVLIYPRIDPLIRFVWIQGDGFSDLITVCHHALADGLGAAYFVRDILTFLGNPETEFTPLPLAPSLEALIPEEVEAALLPHVMAEMEKRAAQPPPPEMPVRPLPPPARFKVHAHELTKSQTASLLARARAEQTTIHGALGAAFLFAFAEQFGETTSYTRTLQSPVNIRSYLSQSVGESLGNFIQILTTDADCSQGEDFWEVARTLRAGFVEKLTPAELFGFSVMIKQMGAIDEATFDGMYNGWIATRPEHVDYDLSLSNIGRLDFAEQYGRFKLRSFYGPTFSSSIDENVAGVCTVNGRLAFTFIHKLKYLESAVAETIVSNTLKVLGKAADWA